MSEQSKKTASSSKATTRPRVIGRALLAAATTVALAATAACSSSSAAPVQGDGEAPTSIRIAVPEPAGNFNLNTTTNNTPLAIGHLINGTLMDLTKDGSAAVPGLAASQEVSADGLTYTFVLRPDLKFSDGTELTAEDVKASLEWQRADEANPNGADFTGWVAIDIPSPGVVEISLEYARPALPILLAAPWHPIYPAEQLGEADFFDQPVSAGKYRIADVDPSGSDAVLEANPHYFGSAPAIAEIEFSEVEDINTRVAQLQSGQIDIATELDPFSAPLLTEKGLEADVTLLTGMYYIFMNTRTGPLSDVRIRKAISAALDREQINQVVWNGGNPGMGNLLPPGIPGAQEVTSPERDLDEARSLLEGTECESGCTIRAIARAGRPIDEKSTVIMKENLAEIGITVEIDSMDSASATQAELSGDFEMEIESLGLPLPDVGTYLKYAVLSTGGIEALFSGFSLPELDEAAQLADVSTGTEQETALQTVNDLFGEHLPYVPINRWGALTAFGAGISDWVTYTSLGYFEVD